MSLIQQNIGLQTMVGKSAAAGGFISSWWVWLGNNYHELGILCTLVCTTIALISFFSARKKEKNKKRRKNDC